MGPIVFLIVITMGSVLGLCIGFRKEISLFIRKIIRHRQAKHQALVYALKYPPKREFRIQVRPTGIDEIRYMVQYRHLHNPQNTWQDHTKYYSESEARSEIKSMKRRDLEAQINEDETAVKYISI